MKIMLVGGYPPPWGGITVHINRLHQYCREQRIECMVIDTINKRKKYNNADILSIRNLYKLLTIKSKVDIVHFHVSAFRNMYLIILLIKYFFKQKQIITIHSGGFNSEFLKMSYLKRKILLKILKSMNGIICVNDKQKELIETELNISKNKFKVIPAFIFPQADGKKIDITFKDIISKWHNKTVLITSGYLFDYYGYDLILDFLEKNKQYKGIFVFYTSNDPAYRAKILERINTLQNAIAFENLTPESFNWLLNVSSIYIRNTDRDGDCVAIREAGFWGKKIIASNCVKRPNNVELFSFNKFNEFQKAVENITRYSNAGELNEQENYANTIINYYQEILNNERM